MAPGLRLWGWCNAADKEWIPAGLPGQECEDQASGEIPVFPARLRSLLFPGTSLKDEVLKMAPAQMPTQTGQQYGFKAFVT